MFHSARIKLTLWYLLIIMLISISFSVVIYQMLTSELDRVERMQRLRFDHGVPEVFRIDPQLVDETKDRLLFFLATINLAILAGSAGAGYFLAGRTLRPILEMVEEQKQFITDASHEIRTPLTSLRSEIEVSLRDKGMTLAESRKILQSNLEEVNNLQVLSDGLIKLTQYQKGNNGLTVTDLSLVSLVNEAIKKVTVLAKSKKITIENKTKDLSLQGNLPALTELLVIILDNAIKYSPKETVVKISSEKNDGSVFIIVADQGIGIDEKDIPHLFDRFYRTDKSRNKADVPGYGLGLSIAKQIVEKHQGSIKIQSKLNQGTTFTIQLPLKHQSVLR